MICLATDFAGSIGQAAIAEGRTVRADASRPAGPGTVEGIIPFLMETISRADLTAADIDLFIATTGPGGFTGIRAGLAAVNGLALAVDRPVCGLTVFDAISLSLKADPCPTLVAVDGRRSDLFVQYRPPGDAPPEAPVNIAPADLTSLIPEGAIRLAGSAADQAGNALLASGRKPGSVRILKECRRVDIAALALNAATGPSWTKTDGPLQPFYGREPDARRPS